MELSNDITIKMTLQEQLSKYITMKGFTFQNCKLQSKQKKGEKSNGRQAPFSPVVILIYETSLGHSLSKPQPIPLSSLFANLNYQYKL